MAKAVFVVPLLLLVCSSDVIVRGQSESETAALRTSLQEALKEIAELKAAAAREGANVQDGNPSSSHISAELDILKKAKAEADAALRHAERAAKSAADAAKGMLAAKTEQLQKVQANLEKVQVQLQAQKIALAADKDALVQAQKATRVAESRMAAAEAKLTAAEAKAADAQTLADNLLAQQYEAWMPHWIADRYERRVRPVAISAYEASRQGAMRVYRSGSSTWDAALPTLQPYVDTLSAHVSRIAQHPHLQAVKDRIGAAVTALTASKAVGLIRENLGKVYAELVIVAATLFKRHPLLAPLGEAGIVGWVVTALLSLPLLVLLLSLRKKKRSVSKPAFSVSTSSGAGTGTGSRANHKSRKGRRISVGNDTVNFA